MFLKLGYLVANKFCQHFTHPRDYRTIEIFKPFERFLSGFDKNLLQASKIFFGCRNSDNTCCAWAGGTFFPVVLLCQFLVLAGNRFWFYFLYTCVLRVQYSCGVVLVFWFWREIVFGVTYVLSVHYSCVNVSVFGCGGKLFSK